MARHLTDKQIADLMMRFEVLMERLELRSATVYEKDLRRALKRIFMAFLDSEDMSDLARRRAVAKVIVSELKPVYKDLGENILEDMAAVAGITNEVMHYVYGGSFVDKALRFNKHTTLFGFELGDLLKSNEAYSVNHFKRIIAQGLAEGKHSRSVWSELKKLGDKKMKHVSSVLVGDAMKEARSQAHADVAHQLEKQGIVKGVQWLSTLEANTCRDCRRLDKRKWKSWDAMIKTVGGTSVHPRCRCSQILLTGKESGAKFRAGITYTEGAPKGKQFDDMDYYTWLKLQPKAVQKLIKSKRHVTRQEVLDLMLK